MNNKIKILIIGMSSIVGGVETYIMNLCENIDLKQIQFDFLVPENFDGIYRKKIEKFGGKIYEVPNFKKHPLKSFKELKKIYKNEKYDIIHTNLCNSSGVLYVLPAKIINKETFVIAHSHTSSDKHRMQHLIFRPILNIITNERVACSNVAAKWMFGNRKKDVLILNNAVNLEKFGYNEDIRKKVRTQLEIDDKFVIGHVGRFEQEKNHIFLIEIFNEIHKKNPKTVLMLIGTGSLLQSIKLKAKELNLEDSILFMGICENTYELYQAMDIFVLPSIFEGLPVVGIEAQASGLKCIFSDNVTRTSGYNFKITIYFFK